MTAFARIEGWQRALNEHLVASQRAYAERGLVWGSFDCCTFAFDWVLKMTGVDPMADYRGQYSSEAEALQRLRDTGHGTLEGALKAVFGDPVAPALTQRGDLVFRKAEKAVGVVITQGVRQAGIFLGEQGLATVPIGQCDQGYRIG